ncbi:hypothetical protein V8G54_009034 [Vigna mungo]|uniref:Secreted protein n=1 Tax=Vigna mungo TaxID=3915 RepID=A0AAQ3P6S1_VIGMU
MFFSVRLFCVVLWLTVVLCSTPLFTYDGLCKSFTNLLAIFRNFQSKELHFLLLSIWYLELVDLFSFLGLQQFFPFVLMTSISDPLSTSTVPPPTPAPLTDSQSSAPIDVPAVFCIKLLRSLMATTFYCDVNRFNMLLRHISCTTLLLFHKFCHIFLQIKTRILIRLIQNIFLRTRRLNVSYAASVLSFQCQLATCCWMCSFI